MDKILRIDMGAPGGPKAIIGPLGPYTGMGGRGMTSMVVYEEVPADCHPLGPENKFVIAPGMVTGSAASTSGRISVGCKSPLTGGIKEANAGGQAGQVMARLGYAAIILEGAPAAGAMYKIVINAQGVDISDATPYKGLRNYDLAEKIKAEYGDKVAMISIGPAGEMRMAAASVAVTDREFRPARHAGRGGVGAVMGAKGVKVIVIDDAGMKMRKPKDPERFKAANKRFTQGLRQHPVTGEGLPTYGTNVLTNVVNEAGAYPAFNFSQGQYDKASLISGETFAELQTRRGGNPTHGCHRGCAIQCSGIYVDKDGNFLTKQPEYETVWSHGGNCGITDPDVICRLDFLDDDIGLDTIDMGAAIGVAMEAGIIPVGDAEGAIRLVDQEVGQGTPLGRILGGGAASTAKAFGLERAPVVKGQAMPAYDPRAVKGVGVTYATSTMGADHTAGYAVATNLLKVGGDVDPLSAEGQIELSRNLQIATAALDATGFCLFIAFAILDQQETFDAMVEIINGMFDTNLTGDDVVALGKKILSMEREFNKKAGFTAADDRLPRYFRREALTPHNVVFDVTDEQLDSLYNW
ncbi:aldehyde ferredoxin oxidoreductase [Desulfosarcina ovata subsp. sediminis]|uniref:Aldehyde ferredoxin oxidoreductase n=1 Tax=Desulfosarcina ovata subsp. sediminis TaxID=885957 RepID=A0A5K7ZZL1_9BACT|nr:aldehyde ferredoxin oxidoreductase C-terminal domain-containing protein [Desulfosarcina ovata]BBO85725.1 aldehyde ferredoxin oxidoreductase [Desulfosarcina ovata subsp. sediminis]